MTIKFLEKLDKNQLLIVDNRRTNAHTRSSENVQEFFMRRLERKYIDDSHN